MIEVTCPNCSHGLQVPTEAMGTSGTCNHCGEHIQLPSLLRYRLGNAWGATWPAIYWTMSLPFAIIAYLIRVFTSPDEFEGMSHAERLLVIEARKQTKIQRANRSDTSCCLGCIIILLILFATGILGPILAVLGIGGAIASQ